MILNKTNTWLEKDFKSKKSTSSRVAAIIEVLNLGNREFIISDGKYFIHSAISADAFEKMCQGYSSELLDLKNSVILLQKFEFGYDSFNKSVLLITECVYLGEGSFSGNFIDFNKVGTVARVNVKEIKMVQHKNYPSNSLNTCNNKIQTTEQKKDNKNERIKPLDDAIISRFLNNNTINSCQEKIGLSTNNNDGFLSKNALWNQNECIISVRKEKDFNKMTYTNLTANSNKRSKTRKNVSSKLNNLNQTNIKSNQLTAQSTSSTKNKSSPGLNSKLIDTKDTFSYRSKEINDYINQSMKITEKKTNAGNLKNTKDTDYLFGMNLAQLDLSLKHMNDNNSTIKLENSSIKAEHSAAVSSLSSSGSSKKPLKDISNSLPEEKKSLDYQSDISLNSLPFSIICSKDQDNNSNELSNSNSKNSNQITENPNTSQLIQQLDQKLKIIGKKGTCERDLSLTSKTLDTRKQISDIDKIQSCHNNHLTDIKKDLNSETSIVKSTNSTNKSPSKNTNNHQSNYNRNISKQKTDNFRGLAPKWLNKKETSIINRSKILQDSVNSSLIAGKIDNYSLENSSVIFNGIDSSLNSQQVFITDSFIQQQCLPSTDSSICSISLETVHFTPTLNFLSEYKPSFSPLENEIFCSSRATSKNNNSFKADSVAKDKPLYGTKNSQTSPSFNLSLENYISTSKWLNSCNYSMTKSHGSIRKFFIDSSEEEDIGLRKNRGRRTKNKGVKLSNKPLKSKLEESTCMKDIKDSNVYNSQFTSTKFSCETDYITYMSKNFSNYKTSQQKYVSFNSQFINTQFPYKDDFICYMSKGLSNSKISKQKCIEFNSQFINKQLIREDNSIRYMSKNFTCSRIDKQKCMARHLDKYYQAIYRHKTNLTPGFYVCKRFVKILIRCVNQRTESDIGRRSSKINKNKELNIESLHHSNPSKQSDINAITKNRKYNLPNKEPVINGLVNINNQMTSSFNTAFGNERISISNVNTNKLVKQDMVTLTDKCSSNIHSIDFKPPCSKKLTDDSACYRQNDLSIILEPKKFCKIQTTANTTNYRNILPDASTSTKFNYNLDPIKSCVPLYQPYVEDYRAIASPQLKNTNLYKNTDNNFECKSNNIKYPGLLDDAFISECIDISVAKINITSDMNLSNQKVIERSKLDKEYAIINTNRAVTSNEFIDPNITVDSSIDNFICFNFILDEFANTDLFTDESARLFNFENFITDG